MKTSIPGQPFAVAHPSFLCAMPAIIVWTVIVVALSVFAAEDEIIRTAAGK